MNKSQQMMQFNGVNPMAFLIVFLLCLCGLSGCLDATAPGRVGGLDQNLSMETMDMSTTIDADLVEIDLGSTLVTGVEADRTIAERVAFIETTIAPRLTYYRVGESFTLTMSCFDEYGERLPAPELVFTPRPNDGANVDYVVPDETIPLSVREPTEIEATLTPNLEGQGAVRICVRRNPDVCGRANYFVDNGPPVIEITSPEEDAVFIGEQDDPSVMVEGTVSGQVVLYVNEEEVIPSEDGHFSQSLPLRFGYNTIEIAADDGFRRPLTRVLRTVLYAPSTLPIEGQRVDIPAPVTLRVPPEVFDGDEPEPVMMGESPTFTDLAHSVSFILGLIDPSGLADLDLSDGETISLSIVESSIGTPEVEFIMQDGYIEAFIRLPNLSARTEGLFSLEGLEVGLEGELIVDISSYITLRPQIVEGEIELIPENSGVAIEGIRGVMTDPVAQALIDTLTSALRIAVTNWADVLVGELLQEELPDILNGQVGSALSLVSAIPFDISDEELGLMISGQIGFFLNDDSALQVTARDGLSLALDVVVDGPPIPETGPILELPEAITGVPVHALGDIPWPANNEVGLAIPLSALNAAIFQIWAQGAFNINLNDSVPPPLNALIGGVRLSAIRPPLLVDTPVGDPSALALSMEGVELTLDAPTQVDPPDPSLSDVYRVSIYFPLTMVLDESTFDDPQVVLDLPESPTLRIGIWKQGGERPIIEPTLIERSVGNLILPELEDLLSGGLAVPLPSAMIDLSGLLGDRAMGNGPSVLNLRPSLSDLLRVDQGWMVISSGLALTPQ